MAKDKTIVTIGFAALIIVAVAYAMPTYDANTVREIIKSKIDVNTPPTSPKVPIQPTDTSTLTIEEQSPSRGTYAKTSTTENSTSTWKSNTEPTATTHTGPMNASQALNHTYTPNSTETPATYKPSSTIAVPIPKKIAESLEQKSEEEYNQMQREANGWEIDKHGINATAAVRTIYKNGHWYVIMDKNASPQIVEEIVRRVLKKAKAQAKVRATVIRKEQFAVVKAVVEENTQTHVEYATTDQGIFAVTVSIPKSEVNDTNLIEGNVIFLQTDPVLRIYLRSEGNDIAVAGFTVKKTVELNTTDTLEFAACTIGVQNVQRDGNTLRFQITDGNQPVYVQSVKIVAPGMLVLPQYDDSTRTYSAEIQKTKDAKIVAYVQGCGEIIYPLADNQETKAESNGGIAAIVAILAIVVATIFVVSRV